MKTLYNPAENKYVDICKDSRGYWAVFIYRVVDGFKREVTAFEKENATSMDKVVDAMKESGFTRKPPVR